MKSTGARCSKERGQVRGKSTCPTPRRSTKGVNAVFGSYETTASIQYSCERTVPSSQTLNEIVPQIGEGTNIKPSHLA